MRQLRVGLFNFSTWHAVLLAFLFLLGCSKDQPFQPLEGDLLKLPSRVEGASDEAVVGLKKELTSCGVKVITIGQDYLVSIPSA